MNFNANPVKPEGSMTLPTSSTSAKKTSNPNTDNSYSQPATTTNMAAVSVMKRTGSDTMPRGSTSAATGSPRNDNEKASIHRIEPMANRPETNNKRKYDQLSTAEAKKEAKREQNRLNSARARQRQKEDIANLCEKLRNDGRENELFTYENYRLISEAKRLIYQNAALREIIIHQGSVAQHQPAAPLPLFYYHMAYNQPQPPYFGG